jgi:hypothetical protein
MNTTLDNLKQGSIKGPLVLQALVAVASLYSWPLEHFLLQHLNMQWQTLRNICIAAWLLMGIIALIRARRGWVKCLVVAASVIEVPFLLSLPVWILVISFGGGTPL